MTDEVAIDCFFLGSSSNATCSHLRNSPRGGASARAESASTYFECGVVGPTPPGIRCPIHQNSTDGRTLIRKRKLQVLGFKVMRRRFGFSFGKENDVARAQPVPIWSRPRRLQHCSPAQDARYFAVELFPVWLPITSYGRSDSINGSRGSNARR